ncbi:MAG: thiamine phosphate synthase, partial [Burkholderiaceae bacterium]
MKPTLDLSLYLVLDPDLCGGLEGRGASGGGAAVPGAWVVHRRAPHCTTGIGVAAATRLKATLDPLQVPLIINDHIDVALLVDAAGVHVGQQDIHPQHARTL